MKKTHYVRVALMFADGRQVLAWEKVVNNLTAGFVDDKEKDIKITDSYTLAYVDRREVRNPWA